MQPLKNKTVFISGASRGIGLEIGLRCAQDGANIVIAAKTAEVDPRLPGTIYTAAKAIEAKGGNALPLIVDVRDENAIQQAVQKTVDQFGGIDILVNNASALFLSPSILETPMKRFDLVAAVNGRATFACSQACLPFLRKANNPHILTLSPPINLNKKHFNGNLAYTISKYNMSLCTLGLSVELAKDGVGVNSLWPKYVVATTAVQLKLPDVVYQAALSPSIVADAAYEIFTKDSKLCTGNFFLDEEVLLAGGLSNIDGYKLNPKLEPVLDWYIS